MNSLNADGWSRRDALKAIGTGAALVGLSGLSLRGFAAEPAAVGGGASGAATAAGAALPQPFTLPQLGYGYDALEPHIDARTMEIHHTKHHQAYINNANKALAEYPHLRTRTAAELLRDLPALPEKVRTTLRNNVGGHANHTFFWEVLSPQGGGEPGSELATALNKAFGSLDAFRTQFTEAAMKRFGSGWAWLSVKDGTLQVHSTANQDSPLIEGARPVLGIDVWEHAYYLHYQNRRADYVKAFWNVVNWNQVATNYRAALG
ncbi:superoxide dismutase [Opitutus terrae]|uniref:superoxide dismutase n=1 Tax=Opitutus terrae (strain DSM 11246 / JCM 15787 / PB90-1) TaxID=452637 RepID=B1ZQN8_OPITP|nr:superoxide dismutase [Opitutus terrae]ACB75647.1 Superoxide dismutase [Opitutus terrae PB90-1]